MAGRLESVIALMAATLLAASSTVWATEDSPSPVPSDHPSGGLKKAQDDKMGSSAAPMMSPPPDAPKDKPGNPDRDDFRKSLKGLPPDQQRRFQQNKKLWDSLTPEQKSLLRANFEDFRRRMKEDIDDAIKQTGLTLNDDQRKAFAKRYTDERRNIERQLHKQMDDQRKGMITDMVVKLKDEFSKAAAASPAPSVAAPSPAASASPSPSPAK